MITIETAHGNIEIELYPDSAPKTVARITELVKAGFYNGLSFHRVVPNFVVQGGDPNGNGTGGSGKKLEAESLSDDEVLKMLRQQLDRLSVDMASFNTRFGTHPDRHYYMAHLQTILDKQIRFTKDEFSNDNFEVGAYGCPL